MGTEDDDSEDIADELRQMLIALGAEPKDLSPLPGAAKRAEQRLAAILQSPREERATGGAGGPAQGEPQPPRGRRRARERAASPRSCLPCEQDDVDGTPDPSGRL